MIDFGTTFNILANQLGGLTKPEKMLPVLSKLAKKFPYIEGIIRKFFLRETDTQGLSREEMLRQVQFVQSFAKTVNRYLIDISGQNGKFRLVDSNRNSIRETTMLRWENNTVGNKKPGLFRTDPKTGVQKYNSTYFK